MALFTRADDAGIPFLTQLVQLDTQDSAEVLRFIWLVHQEAYGLVPVGPEDTQDMADRYKVLGAVPLNMAQEQLREIQELVSAAMSVAADNNNQGFPPGVTAQYAIQAHLHVHMGLDYVNDKGESVVQGDVTVILPNGQSIVPHKSLQRRLVGSRPIAVNQGWEDLGNLLFDPSMACRRCPVCGFPYLVTRAFQMFCSQRCRTRQSLRNNRQKNKEKSSRTVAETLRGGV